MSCRTNSTEIKRVKEMEDKPEKKAKILRRIRERNYFNLIIIGNLNKLFTKEIRSQILHHKKRTHVLI